MKMKRQKHLAWAAQMAWSKAGAKSGFRPVAWYSGRHARATGAYRLQTEIGRIEGFTMVVG